MDDGTIEDGKHYSIDYVEDKGWFSARQLMRMNHEGHIKLMYEPGDIRVWGSDVRVAQAISEREAHLMDYEKAAAEEIEALLADDESPIGSCADTEDVEAIAKEVVRQLEHVDSEALTKAPQAWQLREIADRVLQERRSAVQGEWLAQMFASGELDEEEL